MRRVKGGVSLPVASAIAAALGIVLLASASGAGAAGGVKIRENLYSVKFISGTEGWAVGAFGVIFHTVDGGGSWQREGTGTAEHLFGVDLVGSGVGWAVGRAGTILRRQKDGRWKAQDSGTQRHFFQVAARSAREAWVIGDWGVILHTTDGGATWQDRSLAEDVILNDLVFADREHGWIVGEAGAVFVTADGGMSWSRQQSATQETLFGVDFADLQRGWAVGLDGVIAHTEDGGQTWRLLRGKATTGSLERMGFLEALSNPSLYAVAVAGGVGIAVGDMGTVLLSKDGGLTWKRQKVPAEWSLRWVRDVSLVSGSKTHGMLVGARGLAIPVVDGAILYARK